MRGRPCGGPRPGRVDNRRPARLPFWRRTDVRVRDTNIDRTKRTTIEIQQAIRFNLFHILQASAHAEDTGVAAKGLTGQAYEGHYFWDTEIYLLPFLTY